jgi:hypothetical protein
LPHAFTLCAARRARLCAQTHDATTVGPTNGLAFASGRNLPLQLDEVAACGVDLRVWAREDPDGQDGRKHTDQQKQSAS